MESNSIVLIFLFGAFCTVCAHISDFVTDTATKPWINVEDLKIMINESMHRAICCNIFIAGTSEETSQLFQQFVKHYEWDYTINNNKYGCTGYFMIADTAEEIVSFMPKVPTTISTTEILMIINDDVDDSMEIFKVSMYANAQISIIAYNGLWTLSESYLLPRVFKRVLRLQDIGYNERFVNLQGRELRVATFSNRPFSYLSTSVNGTVAGINGSTLENNKKIDGVEFKILWLIAKKLNFTCSFREPNGEDRKGRRNGSSWNGGLIGQIFHKEVDIAYSGIRLNLDNHLFANLTVPWGMYRVTFLVPRPKPHVNFWALITPLSPEVWSVLIAILIIQSIYVYTSAWLYPQIPKRFRNFTITWTEMMGRLLGTSTPKKMQGLHVQFQLWHFIGILMVTAYSSSLAAKLAKRDYDRRIDTVEELVEASLPWSHYGNLSKFSFYFDDTTPSGIILRSRYKKELCGYDGYGKIMAANYAIIGRMLGSVFYPACQAAYYSDLQNYRVMKEVTASTYLSFAVQPWLLESFNTILLRLLETGLVKYYIDEADYSMSASFSEVFMEYDVIDEKARILELTPLGAGFLLYFVGLFISTIAFYRELRSIKGSRSIREVLLDIKKNREMCRAKKFEMERRISAFKKFIPKKYGFPPV